jgi:D-alanyl-D-alanine carboxypeptidase/D-alanyl-D-alanine-endopeptidase (penicillin-binding protein 4)
MYGDRNRDGGRFDGSTVEGARVVRQFLINAGIDPNDFVFYDGSGLSSHDLVTPRATAKLLQFATTQPWFADWKASLPIGGEDGTLDFRFTKPPLKDHVFAKTGTEGEARALSGYLDCASGRTVIFSILVSNHLPGTTADRDVMDKIVAAIQAAE